MRLDDYTPERIQFGPVPLDDILKDSLYYPACATDGLVCRGYHRPAVLQRRYGAPDVQSEDLDKRILTFPAARRHFIALSVCHQLAPVLYEVVGPEFVFSPFPESITLRDKEGRMGRRQIW